ncbi:hypothetical protein BY996DRAFT_6890958 [Phakopsora pachyrhizi]|nr:hypothetical protein BY996DRAFT_6890958 [Phakopsora pachyrhizi]
MKVFMIRREPQNRLRLFFKNLTSYPSILNVKTSGLSLSSGSGCVSVFVESLLKSIPMVHLCTDINPLALRATDRTYHQNSLPTPNLIQTSLSAGLRIDRSIDLLVFNPPYVETEEAEYSRANSDAKISASWAGGTNGLQLINTLLNDLDSILSPSSGTLYMVAVKENNPEEIVHRMKCKGFEAAIILKRRAGREHLHVLRISRHLNAQN